MGQLLKEPWVGVAFGGLAGVLTFVGLVATAWALDLFRGPAAIYGPPGLPGVVVGVACAPADLVEAICSSFDSMLLYPLVAFLGWAALGTALGEFVWRIARWRVRGTEGAAR